MEPVKRPIHIITALLITALLATELMCVGVSASSGGIFNEHWVSLIESARKYGNNFFGDEVPGFILSIENPDTIAYNVDMTCNAVDDTGKSVLTTNKSFVLKPKTHMVEGIEADVPGYGVYNLNVTLTGEFGKIELTSERFARIAEAEVTDKWLGVQFNIDDNPEKENVEINNYLAKKAGFGAVRDDMRWGKVEPEYKLTNKYKIPEGRARDVQSTLDEGMQQIIIVGDSNSIYEDGRMPATDEGIKAYADYCAYIASYYKGKDVIYELANEPELEYFSGWEPKGSDYAKVLSAGYDAIRKVDPDATVISAGLCSFSSSKTITFLEEMMAVDGIGDKMDGFSVHPYNDNGIISDEQKPSITNWNRKTFLEQLAYANGYAYNSGAKHPPLYVTEYGVSSRNSKDWSYTEREQASDLIRTIAAAKAYPRLKKFVVYNLRETGTDTELQQHNYGLVDYNYTAKPSYLAISFMNKMTGNGEFTDCFCETGYTGARDYSAYRFKGNRKEDVFILWEHTGKTASVKTVTDSSRQAVYFDDKKPLGTIYVPEGKQIRYYDMIGNEMNVQSGAEIDLSGEPVYVICEDMPYGLTASLNGNEVTVKGSTDSPFEDIVITAVNENSIAREVLGADQITSDEYGEFEHTFSISLKENMICSLYIRKGEELVSESLGDAAYTLDVKWSADGKEIKPADISFKNVKLDEIEKFKMEISASGEADGYEVLGAAYSGNGDIEKAGYTKIGREKSDITFDFMEGQQMEKLRFFLWNKNRPVSEALDLTGQKGRE